MPNAAPVLAPERGRTKKGFFPAIAADGEPTFAPTVRATMADGHDDPDPPAVLFRYAADRGGAHAEEFLKGFRGHYLQCDGSEGDDRRTRLERPQGAWGLVHCRSHLRRRFVREVEATGSPVADTALAQIAALYRTEVEIRGVAPERRGGNREGRLTATRAVAATTPPQGRFRRPGR